MFYEIIVLVLLVFVIKIFMDKTKNYRIEDVKRQQKYTFNISVVMTEFHTYNFEVYSDYPYSSIAEIVKNRQARCKQEFIEVHCREKTILLNKRKIISVSMVRCSEHSLEELDSFE